MIIYIVFLVIVWLLLECRNNRNNFNYKLISSFFIILLFLICIFRSTSVGTDYTMYHDLFDTDTYYDMTSNFIEPGYAHLTVLAQEYNNFLIIPAFVFIIGFISLYFIKGQFNVNTYSLISFTVLTGVYFYTFGALRQMIAIGFVYIGISLLFKYYNHTILSIVLFIICIIIAREFHRTAIFAIIFLLLPRIKLNKITVIITGTITTVLLITGLLQSIISKLISKIPYYSSKYQASILTNQSSFGSTIIQSIPVIIQFLFLYLFISNTHINSNKNKFILSGYLLYLCMFSVLNNNIMRRLQFYTFIFPILYSCLFIDNSDFCENLLKKKLNSSSKFLYVVYWSIYYIFKIITGRSNLIPYTFIHLQDIHLL